jgi:O-antigen ligase
LWTYAAGCFYFGWIAFTSYAGGRFEGFTGSGFGEANVAALVLATGSFVAAALFLAGRWRQRAAIVGIIPFIVNGIVTTISRSGFLSTAIGGIAFNVFTPKRYRVKVAVLSLLGLALFFMLTNPIYWARIGTIKYQGEQVEGVDTGAGRLVIIETQWQMFKGHPFGCGHMCTSALSPSYMDPEMLSAGGRASHNTFMTMLVDQGIVGGVFYVAMLLWVLKSLLTLGRVLRGDASFLASVLPAVAAVFAAITVADMFVQYPKLEIRIWFIAVLMVMLRMAAQREAGTPPP